MADSTDRTGQLLGNYRILRLLGQGGFADVYLGEHIHLNTQAAIKLLRTHLVDDSIDNFRSEARTVAHLVHPNIVRVLDFGVDGTIPFLVMEYAPNGTLRQHHPRGTQVPIEILIPYVQQISAALQYAHDQKFIHRDIKPENLLLGSKQEVLLSDFGIAVVTQSMRIQLANLGTSDTAGTVSYMAPEQIRGETVPASDQYALAIVIYEWLTGTLPFKGMYMEVVLQQMNAAPPSLREKVPSLAPDVEQVILTALAKDPRNRFTRIESFSRALVQAVQPKPSTPVSKPLNGSLEVSAMEASLNGSLGRIALEFARLTIGRSQDNGLVVNDLKASSHHAEIRPDGSSYSVVDLNSTNGTFVNEQRLNPGASRLLQPGDTIRIGDTKFSFEARGLSQPGVYSTSGLTVRDVPPALNVSTNFGDYYGGTPSSNLETLASPNSLSTIPPQYTPVPPAYTPPQYTPVPPAYEPPQIAPAPPQYGQAPYTEPQSPVSLPASQPQYGQAQYTGPQSPVSPPMPQSQFAQGQYTASQTPLSPPTSPSQAPQRPRSLMQIIILATIVIILIIGGLGGFFVIHNNQVAQQNADATATASAHAAATAHANATATANANATGTAIANATATAIANANATATAIATSHYPPFTILALNDPLSTNSASGWNEVSECQFTSAGYQVSIAQAGYYQECLATSTNFSDFAYQVTMTIAQGDCGGLVFRAVDAQNYYILYVCQNGQYQSARYVKNVNTGSTSLTTSSAIHTGLHQVNTVAVVVQGDTFNFYVNGQHIYSVTDTTFTHGAVGVVANDNTSPTTVDYTNALVWTAS